MRVRLGSPAILLGLATATTLAACAQIIGANFDVRAAGDAGAGGGVADAGELDAGDAGVGDALAPVVVADHLDLPWGIAARSGYVYWTVAGAGEIMRAPRDGGVATVIASGQVKPDQIAVDGSYAYWTTNDADGGVLRVPVGGGTPEPVADHQVLPIGVAVDDTNVYWTTWDGWVRLAPTGGSSPTTTQFPVKYQTPGLIALDDAHLYFTEYAGDAGVHRLDKDDAGSELLLVGGQPTPNGVAVDATNKRIYFAVQGDVSTLGGVRSAPSDFTVNGPDQFAPQQNQPGAVAVDDTYVYWPTFGDGKVWRLAKIGGTPEAIALDQQSPTGIAVDDAYVYWTNHSPTGSVMKWRKRP